MESDLKHMKKTIKENCGYDEVKDKEYIRNIDFSDKKIEYQKLIKDTEKQLTLIKADIQLLNKYKYRVEEYNIFIEKVLEPEPIDVDLDVYTRDIIREYKKLKIKETDLKSMLVTLYGNSENEFLDKSEVFKNLFKNILGGDKKYQCAHALNAFDRINIQIERKLEQHYIDIKKIDDMEKCIIDNTLGYLKNVYDELDNIDKNSTIELEGKRRKMLIINLPEKDKLEELSLKSYIKNTIENCVSLYKAGKSVEGLLLDEISTYDLFDRFVSISKIEIYLLKIEPNRVKKKTWRQVIEQNSGGEKICDAFVVYIITYIYAWYNMRVLII